VLKIFLDESSRRAPRAPECAGTVAACAKKRGSPIVGAPAMVDVRPVLGLNPTPPCRSSVCSVSVSAVDSFGRPSSRPAPGNGWIEHAVPVVPTS
jgi:hypothetical protein